MIEVRPLFYFISQSMRIRYFKQKTFNTGINHLSVMFGIYIYRRKNILMRLVIRKCLAVNRNMIVVY